MKSPPLSDGSYILAGGFFVTFVGHTFYTGVSLFVRYRLHLREPLERIMCRNAFKVLLEVGFCRVYIPVLQRVFG